MSVEEGLKLVAKHKLSPREAQTLAAIMRGDNTTRKIKVVEKIGENTIVNVIQKLKLKGLIEEQGIGEYNARIYKATI